MVSDAWKEVQLITVHFWDEKPIGDWKVELKFHHREGMYVMIIYFHYELVLKNIFPFMCGK